MVRGMNQTSALPSHVRHLVIGAGFGGLGMAIKLKEAGESDFLVVDKGGDVGGTWRDNTYPGAACDVPSQLYSYSFALNSAWSRSFSTQPEIWAYLQAVARAAGVLDRFAFGTRMVEMYWDEAVQGWRVDTSAGSLTADFVILASGGLSEPRMPDIAGSGDFAGAVFHSARWNHAVDLRGKRVAIIGTGASAIQIIPRVAELAARLDVYQRTPAWVLPRNDRAYTRIERWAFTHIPGVQRAYRFASYLGLETRVPMFTRFPQIAVWNAGGCASWYLDAQGRNVTLWPGSTLGFRRKLARFDAERYEVATRSPLTATEQKAWA